MADQLNETLDKNRENFIGELNKLLDFGIKIRDKLDNLKSLNGFKPKVTKKIFSNFGLLFFFCHWLLTNDTRYISNPKLYKINSFNIIIYILN